MASAALGARLVERAVAGLATLLDRLAAAPWPPSRETAAIERRTVDRGNRRQRCLERDYAGSLGQARFQVGVLIVHDRTRGQAFPQRSHAVLQASL